MSELVQREAPSPNFNQRKLPISMVVLHYTGMETGEAALARMLDPVAEVSAHYMIEEDGTVFRLVDEDKRAWHAGKSYWRGITDVNSASIGIELVNPGHEFGYRPFTDAQMEALCPLLFEIKQRHDIPRANVVGHSDIAPARKEDPGELFDWDLLGELGLALPLPDLELGNPFDNDGAFMLSLERFGYDIADPRAAVTAFQRRWRPRKLDGEIDNEIGAMLFALLVDRDRGLTR
ncbi:MAG TPA: N-acetylmuramoyl-L-alanine amidase [Sphingomonadaceae bacterium]|nr:N-acetylmuramoyl-L-alanine amidase [Sphingomonadaceae bacterium]